MGNCMHSYEKVYEHPNVRPHVKLFDDFQITAKELSKFYDMFVLFDSNKNGTIEVDEFMKHLDITRTPFAYRIFRVMDDDSSGAVTFREFVMSIWNICTLANSTLEKFAFDLYDKDNSGELTVDEVHQMLQDVYGTELQRNQHARSISHALEGLSEHEVFTIETFHAFIQKHPNFFFPAIFLQNILQTEMIGMSYWEKSKIVRRELSGGKEYVRWKKLLHDVETSPHFLGHIVNTKYYTTGRSNKKHEIKQKQVASSITPPTVNSTSLRKPPPPPSESPSVPTKSILRNSAKAPAQTRKSYGYHPQESTIVEEAFQQLAGDFASVSDINREYRKQQQQQLKDSQQLYRRGADDAYSVTPVTSVSVTGNANSVNNSRNSSRNNSGNFLISPRENNNSNAVIDLSMASPGVPMNRKNASMNTRSTASMNVSTNSQTSLQSSTGGSNGNINTATTTSTVAASNGRRSSIHMLSPRENELSNRSSSDIVSPLASPLTSPFTSPRQQGRDTNVLLKPSMSPVPEKPSYGSNTSSSIRPSPYKIHPI